MGLVLSQEEYLEKLVKCRSDHSKFQDMQQDLFGIFVSDKLVEEFALMFDFKVTCAKVPNLSYAEGMELRVLAHEMVVADLPKTEQWRTVQQFGSNKYNLQP